MDQVALLHYSRGAELGSEVINSRSFRFVSCNTLHIRSGASLLLLVIFCIDNDIALQSSTKRSIQHQWSWRQAQWASSRETVGAKERELYLILMSPAFIKSRDPLWSSG